MQIIVNADDFGKSYEVNLGIVEGFKRGLLTRTTIMVNMPFADEAVQLAKDNNFFDKVGLHLNLTEGDSLTQEIQSLPWIDKKNRFNEGIRQYMRRHFLTEMRCKSILKKEIESQMNKYRDYSFPLFHIDSHQHIHNEWYIYYMLKPLCIKYGFNSMRILRNLMSTEGCRQKAKYLYKVLLNNHIKSHFEHTDYFGSYADYLIYNKKKQLSTEIMVHPIMHQGKLYDIVDGELILMDNYKLNDD